MEYGIEGSLFGTELGVLGDVKLIKVLPRTKFKQTVQTNSDRSAGLYLIPFT